MKIGIDLNRKVQSSQSKIGILALQGSVIEHIKTTRDAAKKVGLNCKIIEVRNKEDFQGLDALIIPGGESTTLMKLIKIQRIEENIRNVKNILGTCAGAIILSKSHLNLLELEVDRNAYGSQLNSFEQRIETDFGEIKGIFIRAPKFTNIGDCKIIAKNKDEIVGIESKKENRFVIALCFHPELVTTKIHEYFLKNII